MVRLRNSRRLLAVLPVTILCSLIAAKCIRPIPANPARQGLAEAVSAPPAVAQILERSCQDCHSNRTSWPWYSRLAPVSWFVLTDVEKGRAFLNLSEWESYSKGKRLGYLASMAMASRSDRMPPRVYTFLHPGARLTETDRQQIADWAKAEARRIRTAGKKS